MTVDHFSSLPNEVLVKIISFLPETPTGRNYDMCHRNYERSVKRRHCGTNLCGLIASAVKKNVYVMY